MRYVLSVLIILASFQVSSAQDAEKADVHPEYGNLIKLSPFSFGRSHFEISYEHYFKNRTKSIVISPTFMLKESSFESFRGVKLGAQFRIYLNNLHNESHSTWFFDNIGYYAAPFVSGTIYAEDRQLFLFDPVTEEELVGDYTNDIQAGETGILIGGQFHITPRFVIDLFAGGAIRYAVSENNVPDRFQDQPYFSGDDTFDQGYTGIKPAGGFMIGFTF